MILIGYNIKKKVILPTSAILDSSYVKEARLINDNDGNSNSENR
jgi:hypothetical protein